MFSAILVVGFHIKKDAMTTVESFDLSTQTYNYVESGMKRWVKGFKVECALNRPNCIYFLGALPTAALFGHLLGSGKS